MYGCTGGYGWNGSACATPPAYSSSMTYTPGQAFTWNGATVTVTATGLGTSSTKAIAGCDTNDIAVWQGGTNNVQIWAACNMGSTVAGVSTSSYGGFYQWGNNADVTSAVTSGTQVNTSTYGPGNYYNSSTFITGFVDWGSSQNDNLWGNTTNTSVARQGMCPVGYHVPSSGATDTSDTLTDFGVLFTIMNVSGTFGSCNQGNVYDRTVCTLKLPYSGYRDRSSGLFSVQGTRCYYWSSSPDGITASHNMNFWSGGTYDTNPSLRAYAFPVRCIRN